MTDGDRPLNNDWVLGPEPLDIHWEDVHMGAVRSKVPTGSVRRLREGICRFCGAPTKLIGRRLFCRDCGYFEGCCDGGKEALEGEC